MLLRVISGIGLLLWAGLDMYTGKSIYFGGLFGSAKFDEYDDGPVYWLVVGLKIFAGLRLVTGV